LTGSIPALSGLTNLAIFHCYTNQLTAVEDMTIPLSLTTFYAQNNLFDSIAINKILAAFVDNLVNRPNIGTLNIGGTGNAAPTGQGILDKASIIAHGWTVTTN